jgi:hypothetical protein
MENITFSKKSNFGAKGESRDVTDSAAYQFAKSGLIENAEKIMASVDKKRLQAAKAEAAEKEKAEKRAQEKLALRQEELKKDHNALEQAKKNLKEEKSPFETKEEKKTKTTKAPKL